MRIQKLATFIMIFLFILNPIAAHSEDAGSGFVDDSVKDMSVVFGMGLAGAILGLSTLSFVDEPSQHTKNIAVGGAVGIIIGVSAVIVGQASKTSLSKNSDPINEFNFDRLKREEFSSQKIAENLFLRPNITYQFNF